MAETRAAYRYALAIIGIAEETKQLETVSADFDALSGLMKGSREFYLFLKSPVINKEKKKSVLSDSLKGKVSEVTYQFLRLLMMKGREDIIPEIIQQFNKLRDERMGIVNVTVRSAITFTKEQEQQLAAQLNKVTKKKPRFQFVTDPSLISGFTVQYEDTVWDGSVRHQLELLRKRFVEGSV